MTEDDVDALYTEETGKEATHCFVDNDNYPQWEQTEDFNDWLYNKVIELLELKKLIKES